MEIAILYYRQNENESEDEAINNINILLKKYIQKNYNLKAVFFDYIDSRNEFYNLLNISLDDVDVIILPNELNDDFDNKLLSELSKSREIEIKVL
ncbi:MULTISPECIES: hypothetical protein [Bacillus]|uniref:hypothetical protein n=1 Tax=Bacillus TaxID=1386 RepID=UPI0006CD570C|nr:MULTISPECIES: hypothetical protein [Bacillus]MBL3613437.1 hypothetical protein [Bacillus sp. RHFS18]AMQ71490.1 hypothetical protein BAMY6639_10340 [Bacillus amyloliquefaciens UMAF6639]ATL41468.1 hypothetical protein CQJ38_18990 [Bacillus velezensis]KAF6549819.1 hypothetical protein G9F51_06180 [Bacillus sp. EKM207B]KAF6551414.1 hypothetical protein G9F50_00490 [Bacillus sp. EKM206B]